MNAAMSSSSDSAIAETVATRRTWPLTPLLKVEASLTIRSIVNSTLRACSSTERPAGVGWTPRRERISERRAEVVLELGDPLAHGRGLDVLLRGGARHVLVVADRDQQAQGLEIDVSHGSR